MIKYYKSLIFVVMLVAPTSNFSFVLRADETQVNQETPTSQEAVLSPPYVPKPGRFEFVINVGKKKYRLGEPIFIKTEAHYTSTPYKIGGRCSSFSSYLAANVIKVVDANDKPVPMNRYGQNICPGKEFDDRDYAGIHKRFQTGFDVRPNDGYVRTPDGMKIVREAIEWELECVPLNTYFDLSVPGKYKITYSRRMFDIEPILDPPVESNTVEIEIVDEILEAESQVDAGPFRDLTPEEEKKRLERYRRWRSDRMKMEERLENYRKLPD